MAQSSFLIVTKELLADKRLSATAKLLLATLREYRNKRTGQCNPWETTLAAAMGVSKRTIIRRLKELKAAGLMDVKRTQRGNRYEFPKCQSVTSQVTECHSAECQSVTWGTSGPLYEPDLRNLGDSAPKRAARSFPKENSYNTAPVQRKSITREVLEIYYRDHPRKVGEQ